MSLKSGSTFKNIISNEAIAKAQKENQNTINLLEDFRYENAKKNARIHIHNLTVELGEKEEALLTAGEQLRDTGLEYARAQELLEKTNVENTKLKVELENIKNELSSVKAKFNAQLEKNDELRHNEEIRRRKEISTR